MNKEIDIIELLQRVKEGKAPKEIEIDNDIFKLNMEGHDGEISSLYYKEFQNTYFDWTSVANIKIDTKIKILDKPIIEELPESDMFVTVKVGNKINEIIEVLNGRNL